MQTANPFLLTLAGLLVGALLTFALNVVFNRSMKRVDRRQEWYDMVDKDRTALVQQLQAISQQLQELQRQAQQMQQSVNEVQRLMVRMEIAEQKIGTWWRYVEDQIPDMLRPPPRQYSGP
jgi:peptidoglycan hydrolase CwlO-like protein